MLPPTPVVGSRGERTGGPRIRWYVGGVGAVVHSVGVVLYVGSVGTVKYGRSVVAVVYVRGVDVLVYVSGDARGAGGRQRGNLSTRWLGGRFRGNLSKKRGPETNTEPPLHTGGERSLTTLA